MIWPQVGILIFSLAFAWQQSYAVKLFIDYVPQAGGSMNMDKYHKVGAWLSVVICLLISFLAHSSFVTTLVVCLSWHWLVFDIALNVLLKKPWDYIGQTAYTDRWLNQLFPHGDAGEVKAASLGCIILVSNIIESYL